MLTETLAPLDAANESPDTAAARAELRAAQQQVDAQLAAVEGELAAARKAGRTREVELLLDKSARLVDVSAKLHEQKAMQLALQVEAARKALPHSDGAPSCKHAAQ